MTISLQVPEKQSLKPTITVFGVGGAGGNAVNNMITSNLEGVNFVIANTDAQAMEEAECKHRIQLGEAITQGLGAGSYPEVGRASAEEAVEDILDYLQGSNMVFITAGLGGGTGTGAAPVVARLAKEQGILTVGVVTKPFHFEGTHRMRVAEIGLQEMQKYVDTLIVIPNQNLFRVADKNTTFLDAFKLADEVLHSGVRGITDLMVMPGLINLDFSDVRSVMGEMGKAMMGTGEAEGENRSIEAAEAAIANPLLDNVSMKGARGVLINITGGPDMTLFEVDEAANRIRDEVDPEANIIFGSSFDKDVDGKIRVSVVATGIEHSVNEVAPKAEVKSAPVSSAPVAVKPEVAAETKVSTGSSYFDFISSTVDANNEVEEVENNVPSDGAFISPEPVEPKSVQQEVRVETREIPARKVAESGGALQVPDALFESKKPSLFGGFFGGGYKKSEMSGSGSAVAESAPVDAPADRELESVGAESVTAHKSKTPITEDDLDIPAFMRRK